MSGFNRIIEMFFFVNSSANCNYFLHLRFFIVKVFSKFFGIDF